jgi:1-acyl-sn-glycerol-3-phosphate acyltransferase
VSGREHLRDLEGPVVFAANHQSHLDVPVILAALPGRWRARVAPAMQKEFFKAHFFPEQYGRRQRWHQSRSTTTWPRFFFQRLPAAPARGGRAPDAALHRRADGDGWSVLIFPEGAAPTGEIKPFRTASA